MDVLVVEAAYHVTLPACCPCRADRPLKLEQLPLEQVDQLDDQDDDDG